MITVYTVAYNEEFQLPHFIEWYRKRFIDCNIVVYDNYSTDKTVEIAKDFKCEVIQYDTNNKLSDSAYLNIKNNCWKNSKTDWVCIADVDECVNVTDLDLIKEERDGVSILAFNGFNMINMLDNYNINDIDHGVRDFNFDKKHIFNKNFIKEINYFPGCHSESPVGDIKYSRERYDSYHFNFINLQMSLDKYEIYSKRLSEENKKNGWGSHYLLSKNEIENEFNNLRKKAIKIL